MISVGWARPSVVASLSRGAAGVAAYGLGRGPPSSAARLCRRPREGLVRDWPGLACSPLPQPHPGGRHTRGSALGSQALWTSAASPTPAAGLPVCAVPVLGTGRPPAAWASPPPPQGPPRADCRHTGSADRWAHTPLRYDASSFFVLCLPLR